jgi:hypothetical protein
MSSDDRGISRRDLFAAGAATGMGVLLGSEAGGGAQAPAPAAANAAEELVFVNARIHTMNAANLIVNTVTMRNGRFTAVGGPVPRPAQGRRIVDLRGRTVIPGIIDNHNHIVLMGNRPGYHTPLENAASIRDVQETLAARAKACRPARGSRRSAAFIATSSRPPEKCRDCRRWRNWTTRSARIRCTSAKVSAAHRQPTAPAGRSSKVRARPFPWAPTVPSRERPWRRAGPRCSSARRC